MPKQREKFDSFMQQQPQSSGRVNTPGFQNKSLESTKTVEPFQTYPVPQEQSSAGGSMQPSPSSKS